MAKMLEVKLVRSVIGNKKWMRTIVRTMGLRKLNDSVILPDSPATRGQINKVSHLVVFSEKEESANG